MAMESVMQRKSYTKHSNDLWFETKELHKIAQRFWSSRPMMNTASRRGLARMQSSWSTTVNSTRLLLLPVNAHPKRLASCSGVVANIEGCRRGAQDLYEITPTSISQTSILTESCADLERQAIADWCETCRRSSRETKGS